MRQVCWEIRAGNQNVVYVDKHKGKARQYPVSCWKDMPAFFRPKGMRKNSYSPNGVMTAVLGTAEL